MIRLPRWKVTLSLAGLCLALHGAARAFPNLERPDNPALKPLNFGLTVASDGIVVSPDDRYIVVNDKSQMVLIDTATWEQATDQFPVLEDSALTAGYVFLPNTTSLFVYQNNGRMTRFLTDDILGSPLIIDISATVGNGSGPLVADTELADGHLFLLNVDTDTIFEYNIADRAIEGEGFVINVTEDGGAVDMAYAAMPAGVVGNTGGEVDRIIFTTDQGKVVIIDENLTTVATLDITTTHPNCADTASDNLTAVAVSPSRQFGYVLNPTDNVIHVIDMINAVEVDADDSQSGINPICLHQVGPGGIDQDINNGIADVVVITVSEPSGGVRGYVTGDNGVTVFNGVPPFNFEDVDPTTDEIESITLSAEPNLIAASSQADGYVYTANIPGSLSVISENPFVTIQSIDPNSVNEGTPTFTVTFQADEVCEGCHYRVRANGDIDESGTLLLDAAFTAADMANTNLTTPAIDINAFPDGTFVEGPNSIFVFVDDAAGNTGRDSIALTVDRPPPDVVILGTDFGNGRGFVEIERLTDEDLKQYNVYVLPAIDQANPTCPGGLDFAAVASPFLSVAQPGSGSKVRITIDGLENGTAYCVAVEAEDNAGNRSANRVVAPEFILPEVTVGITEASGETGCRLNPGASSASAGGLLVLALAGAGAAFWRRGRRGTILAILLGLSLLAPPAQATEVSDQHWTAAFQGGFFLPTDDNVDRFLGKCCNGMYQLTFGRLFKGRYEVNLGVAFMVEDATAIGLESGRPSGERFNFSVVPISNSFVYRGDFHENQLFVPFVGAGFDYMYFRENLQGQVTEGMKFGYHVMGGVQILMEWFDAAADSMEEFGINDTYLTLEGRWNQIDNFGGDGLAFNGFTLSAGILFNF